MPTDAPPHCSHSVLKAAQQGDAAAFCTLVREHEGRLLGQAHALCRDRTFAEDLVQEALVEAWNHLHRYDGSSRLSTWLYSILLHRHRKALRYARIRPFFCFNAKDRDAALVLLYALEEGPDENLARKEGFQGLMRQVNRLSPKHREVILLRFFADAPLEEIASTLRCSLGTVKSRLFHALEKLRKMHQF